MGQLIRRDGDGVTTVVLDNPGKLNAMTRDMWLAFEPLWRAINADSGIRCVVVTGGDPRGFCPGNDISEFEQFRSNESKARELSAIMNKGRDAMLACPHPVIARIHGACVGGGLEIAAMCDMRIGSEESRYGAPLNRIGLTMAYEEMLPIWRITDEATLFEFLVEGRIIDAQDALRRGLLNRVVPTADLDHEVEKTAKAIAEGPPLVNRWHKQFLRRLRHEVELSQEDHDVHYLAFETEDYREGYQSFLARTKPKFKGR